MAVRQQGGEEAEPRIERECYMKQRKKKREKEDERGEKRKKKN